jgi:hypothetical protein
LQTTTPIDEQTPIKQSLKPSRLLPIALFLGLEMALLLIGAALPLYGLWFTTSSLNDLFPWLLLPTLWLFPGRPLNPTLLHAPHASPPFIALGWQDTGILFALFAVQFLLYAAAIHYLPRTIKLRSIVLSLLIFGLTCSLFAAVTSPDIFSYIAYARIGVLYGLNPLTAVPHAISHDPTYQYIYWVDQPSAYGPVWAFISCSLQWLTGMFGTDHLAPMVLALRLLGLVAHLWSTLLIWSIAGYLQHARGEISARLRMQATLAFAWNPLLLFEACVNAHNDTVVFLFVLLALWFLVRKQTPQLSLRTTLIVTTLLALSTCLKANVALLFPGFLLYLWARRDTIRTGIYTLCRVSLLYAGIIIALYAPFWQQGRLLAVLQVNPGTNRNINTLADFLTRLYNSVAHLFGAPIAPETGSPAENLLRLLSLALFLACYALLCWQPLREKYRLTTPLALIRWMTLAWFVYMLFGAPWFWPWYTVAFFGFAFLLEAANGFSWHLQRPLQRISFPQAARLFSFSLLSLYCLYTWSPYTTFLPGLADFRWAFLRGLWVWLVPLLVLALRPSPNRTTILTEAD